MKMLNKGVLILVAAASGLVACANYFKGDEQFATYWTCPASADFSKLGTFPTKFMYQPIPGVVDWADTKAGINYINPSYGVQSARCAQEHADHHQIGCTHPLYVAGTEGVIVCSKSGFAVSLHAR